MRVINLSTTYQKRPSEILNIEDDYLAFCFDEACMYITQQIKDDKTPRFSDINNNIKNNSEFIAEFGKS